MLIPPTHAWIDSEIVPIWLICGYQTPILAGRLKLTLRRRALQAFFSTAVLIRRGLVTVRSSPTIWTWVEVLRAVHDSQSSWSKGSSMETMSYFSMYPL